MPVTAVVGAQWGDEGKGRVVDYLGGQADMVIRFQGGDNAGHTVINHFGLFKLHLPIDKDSDAHHFWEEVHEYTWQIMAILLAVHVLGALYNHFVLKNDVLRRMTHGVRQVGG